MIRGSPRSGNTGAPAWRSIPISISVCSAPMPGSASLVLHYQSVQGLVGAECMEFDTAGLVRRVLAHYALGSDPVAA